MRFSEAWTMAETEAVVRQDPNFMPVEEWRDKVRAQLVGRS